MSDTKEKKPKLLTPMEHVAALADYLPVVADVLISEAITDSRGQTARLTFNEDDGHPLANLFTDSLGNWVPSKQFKILIIELDDNAVPVDQVRRDKVSQMMNGQGRFQKQFYAILRDEWFHRYLYTLGVKDLGGDLSASGRATLAREWSDSIGIDPQALDNSSADFNVFVRKMRDPFYTWRDARKRKS